MLAKTRFATLLLALLLTACGSASVPSSPGPQPPAPAASPAPAPSRLSPTVPTDLSTCDLTASLQVSTWLGNHKVNDVGTQECDYLVWLHNTHRTESIVPVVFQRKMDAFKGTDETRWEALRPLTPGERYDWQGYVYLVNDPRAAVPMARIPKTIVALKLDDACTSLQSDSAYLHAHAVTVDEPCSSDLLLWPDFMTSVLPGPIP